MASLRANEPINFIRSLGRFGETRLGRLWGADVAAQLMATPSNLGLKEGFIKWFGSSIGEGGAFVASTFGQKVARTALLAGAITASGRVLSGRAPWRDRAGRFDVPGIPIV